MSEGANRESACAYDLRVLDAVLLLELVLLDHVLDAHATPVVARSRRVR